MNEFQSNSEIIAFLVKNLNPQQLREFANAGSAAEAYEVISNASHGFAFMLLAQRVSGLSHLDLIAAAQNHLATRKNIEAYEFLCQTLVERHGKEATQRFAHTTHPWNHLQDINNPKEIGAAIAECLLADIDARHMQKVEKSRLGNGEASFTK